MSIKYVIMIPDLNPGESTILMTWETNPPADLDIYVAAISNADDSVCVISFENQQCPNAAAEQTRFENHQKLLLLMSVSGTMLLVVTMDQRVSIC